MSRRYGSLVPVTIIVLAVLGTVAYGSARNPGVRASSAPSSTSRTTAVESTTSSPVVFSSLVEGTLASTTIPQLNIQLTKLGGTNIAVTASKAFRTAASASTPFPVAADVTASGSYELMSYTNLVAKNIGSSTLEYNSVPAWVFTWTLATDIDPPVGLVVPTGVAEPGDGFVVGQCKWISIVDATANSVIEAGQVCPGT